MDFDVYVKKGWISRIVETELDRYCNFFANTSKENLELANYILEAFPRWSIISGYYAMHDFTKLFLAKRFSIKIEFRVHATTILIMQQIVQDKEILALLRAGYGEFIKMANDLAQAKEERTKAQYYTGSEFMKGKYKEQAENFLKNIVSTYIKKLKPLIEGDKNDI